MRDAILGGLVVLTAGLAYAVYSQHLVIDEQSKALSELRGKVEGVAQTGQLSSEEMCAKAARSTFQDSGWGENKTASYISHFNSQKNKCFMVTGALDTSSGALSNSRILIDSVTRSAYGQYQDYLGANDISTRIIMCFIIGPDGGRLKCSSLDQFDEGLKDYMEGVPLE